MLTCFFGGRERLILCFGYYIHLDLLCQLSKSSGVLFFFPSLHAENAQYPNPNCDHMPVGTEEPVFNISSKLKGEMLCFYVHNGSALTLEGIIAFLCFTLFITCLFSLVIQVAVQNNCLKQNIFFSISPSWKVKPRNKKCPTLKLSLYIFFLFLHPVMHYKYEMQ